MTNKHRFNSSIDIPRAVWLRLWGHKSILHCHKLLWWQLLSNALPTRDKLNSLFFIDDILCPICMTSNETVAHLLFSCDFSRHFWLASPWNLRTELLVDLSPLEGLRFIWDVESKENQDSMADRNIVAFAFVLFDLMWKCRNDIAHGRPTNGLLYLLQSISRTYRELLVSFNTASTHNLYKWDPPPAGWIKINLDVVVREDSATIACVALNAGGSIVKWTAKKISTSSPFVAEALVALFAVELAVIARWPFVLFVSDSKMVAYALNAFLIYRGLLPPLLATAFLSFFIVPC
ncbi:hypothetical protein UlMin_005265 [Ulmus minor]